MPDLSNIDFTPSDVYEVGAVFRQLGTIDYITAGQEVVSNGPTLSGWSPATGTAIGKETPISLEVQPTAPNDGVAMRRVMLLASFPTLGMYEVVHDGDSFSQAYPAALGNVRTANGFGFTFTVLRKEGWPASPRLVPVAVDVYGAINPISPVVYGWTLI